MSNIDAREFLDIVAGYSNSGVSGAKSSSERPVKLGTIDQYYTSGLARVTFDGESILSTKGYSWNSSYSPVASDRVYLIPVGQSYIIGGKVQSSGYAKFIPITLQNGWVNYDTNNYFGASVTKSPSGIVKIAGVIKSGTATAGTVIGNLPAPFRPTVYQSFPAVSNGTAAGVDIWPNGDIKVGTGGSNIWFSLDNIMYPTDPTLVWNAPSFVNSWSNYGPNNTQAGYAIDAYKRVWFRGCVKNPTNPTAVNTMFNVPVGYRSVKQLHLPIYGISTFAFMDALNTGDIRWKQGSGGTGYDYIDGMFYHEQSITDWTDASYQNGWTSNDTNVQPAAGYRKDADGMVYLRGLVKSGTMSAAIFNLPPGFRPSRTYIRSSVAADAHSRIDVGPTGNVTPLSGSNVWQSLDGISFPAEQ